MIDPKTAQKLLKYKVLNEKCAFYCPCGGIEDYIKLLDSADWEGGKKNIFILRAGNGVGKTTLGVNLAAYLAHRTPNKWLGGANYLKHFKKPNRGRIYTTGNAAATSWQDETKKWFPVGRYNPIKAGYKFYSAFAFSSKSYLDIFTFDRDPMQSESTNLDWVIIDEPIPYKFWTGIISRLRWGGPIFILMTALENAAWMSIILENSDRINKDVFVKEVKTEDACREHGIRGHLPHAYIESIKKECEDESEMEARTQGKYLSLSGAIYKSFSQEHIVSEYIPYWRECIKSGHYNIVNIVDPHPRKPFCIGWYYVFPNADVVCIAEWPDDSFLPFHKLKSADYGTADYAEIIKATEKELPKKVDRRLMDPNMGNSPGSVGGKSIKMELQAKGLIFHDPIDNILNGHQAVKGLLARPSKGERPSLYFMEHCKNHIFSMKNYGWKDSRKSMIVSETPDTQYDDFADNVRYGAMSGFKYRPPVEKRESPPIAKLPKSYGGKK